MPDIRDQKRLVPMSEDMLVSRMVAVGLWALVILVLALIPVAYEYVMRNWAW